MTMTDPISDMLTRIRNANIAMHDDVRMPSSKVKEALADILHKEGYIEGYDVIDDGRQGQIRVRLKYGPRGETLINRLKRESSPGRRVYTKVDDLPRPIQGLGIVIVSTSKGVMSDRRARENNVGGELLCTVS